MGTDIHPCVEVKAGGKWRRWQLNPVPCKYCEADGTCFVCHGSRIGSKGLYEERNYRLFGILADVRNDWGLTPISQPKGLPPEWGTSKEDDSHSHSWLTLAELEAYDWDAVEKGQTMAEHVGSFYSESLPRLRQIAEEHGGPENVRLVFWFDS